MLKKINLPVLVTVMCGLVLVVILLYGYNTGRFDFLKNKNQKQVAVQKEEEKIVRTDYTEVARKTLDWVDKQRNEDGWYILARACGEKDCEVVWDDKEVGNKDGLIATWVRLNFYEQHQDPKDLEIVKKDIDLFYQKYKDKDLSDSLWLCKIGYEMAQSKYIDQGQKEKLKELCLSKKVVEIGGVDLDKEKEKLSENLDTKELFGYFNMVIQDVHFSFGGISDLVYQYRFSGNGNYLKTAKDSIEKSKSVISKGQDIGLTNKCLVGIGGIDTYGITKSKSDLDYAMGIYEQVRTVEGITQDPFCGLFGKKLYNITMDNQYVIDLENNNKKLIGQNYDEVGFFLVGDGGPMPNKGLIKNSLFIELIR